MWCKLSDGMRIRGDVKVCLMWGTYGPWTVTTTTTSTVTDKLKGGLFAVKNCNQKVHWYQEKLINKTPDGVCIFTIDTQNQAIKRRLK